MVLFGQILDRKGDNMEINKIITLGNGEKYLVIDKVEKDEKEYYYVAEVNEDETNIKDNYKIVTTSKRNDDLFIDEVLGEDKLKDILPLFIKE